MNNAEKAIRMNIIVDAMGGDNAPDAIVQGALLASRESAHNIVLVGLKEEIKACVEKYAEDGDRPPLVVGASQAISNNEPAARAVRAKKDSSMAVGLNIVKDGMGSVFISAGSTGALLAGALTVLGRIKGINRPAICSVYPVIGREASLLVDAGANSECKARHLLQFGIMGSLYMEKVLGRPNPRVALVNVGAESKKGTALTREAYELLSESGLNFCGNIEARELPRGGCDVIVADGFTGNVILKLTEGMGEVFMKMLGASSADSARELDYTQYGGAPILGVSKPVIKMHGSSNAKAVKNAILRGIDFAEGRVVELIKRHLEK